MEKLLVAAKFLLSFLKRDWEIDDYPIRIRSLKVDMSLATPRWKPIPWVAQVVNWWALSGGGQSKAEALADLRPKFQARKATGARLPRPGTKVPIELASTVEVDRLSDIGRDFLAKVLDLNPGECFISDESSLWDFHSQETNDALYERIRNIYGVDVSGVEGANLCAIFRKIKADAQQ
ncbi:MAG: hypothetical protein ABSF45_29485 [Terriglobia bacterium]|jgi:hypothetical protein